MAKDWFKWLADNTTQIWAGNIKDEMGTILGTLYIGRRHHKEFHEFNGVERLVTPYAYVIESKDGHEASMYYPAPGLSEDKAIEDITDYATQWRKDRLLAKAS